MQVCKIHVLIIMCVYIYPVVTIATPPENTTVCRGSNVNISCGYISSRVFPTVWVINGTPYEQSALQSSPLYQLNNPANPMNVSLTIFSINDSTTIQCIVQSNPVTYSTRGTITVTGMCVCNYVYALVTWELLFNQELFGYSDKLK